MGRVCSDIKEMDAFTATLSAVSCVKKLVDLAEKLHDSFQKLSRNKQMNDRLSASTLKSVRRLERFYLEHSGTFSDARESNDLMLELKTELESVYEKTQAFVSIPSTGRLSRVKPIFNAWLDRNKIEGELMELNGRIQECHTNFCTFAILQSNLNTHRLLASTSRLEASTTAMHQDLLVLRNPNRMAGSHHGAEATTALQVVGKKQTTMTGRANCLVSRSPEPANHLLQVPEGIIAEIFLQNKIRSIGHSLTKFARPQKFHIENPISCYLSPFRSVFRLFRDAAQQESCRDNAIVKAISISDILQKHCISVSIQEGALELLDLAIMFLELRMFHDAVTISTWAADLFRTMVNAGPVVYHPYFGLALTNLAHTHLRAGNLADATQAVMASLEFHRQQLVVFDDLEMKGQLARSLVLSARIATENGEYDQAFKHAIEAANIYQGIYEVHEGRDLKAILELDDGTVTLGDEEAITSDLGTHRGVAIGIGGQDTQFVGYSYALVQLAWAYHDIKHYQKASDTGRQALKMIRHLWETFPGHFLQLFADINYFLSQASLRTIITAEEALPYAIQSADLYRTICGDSKGQYIHSYYNSLRQCGSILESLGRHDEALKRAQEMARVAKEITEDQYVLAAALKQISRNLHLLKRLDEAARFQDESIQAYRIVYRATSEHEGVASYRLSRTLEGAGWYQEAILAGQDAIMHYRILATNGDIDHVRGLIDAHILLAACLTAVEEFDWALDEGREALQLLEVIIDDESSLLPTYLWGLQVVVEAARSENASKSMERSQDVIRRFRKLHITHPTETVKKLPALSWVHFETLLRCNKTHEASKWLDEVEKWYRAYPLPMPFNLMASYLSSLLCHGDLFMKLGQARKGLEVTVRMIELWKSLPPEVEHDISALHIGWNNQTEMLIYLGKYEEALESTVGPIANARVNPSQDTEDIVDSLVLASSATSCIGEHRAALHLAEEAVQICRQKPIALQSDYTAYSTIKSLWRLGETHADMGGDARSLGPAKEAYHLAAARKHSELYWGDLHHAFTFSQFLLALQLSPTGDLESALRHLEELVETQKDNTKARPGYYPLYMNALRTLSWCYCALGRHEEGVLRRDELGRLAKMQGLVNPDIAAPVHVELQAAARRPSRIALWKKIDLRCGHQQFGGPGVVVD